MLNNLQTEQTKNVVTGDMIVNDIALQALVDCLTREPVIAIDTEADSLYAYFDKVCLIQFSTRTADYLVDPLALQEPSPLAPIFASGDIVKVFHACEYDILCLKRDFQFEFRNVFDTMIAARILGWKNVGLGNILMERFGVTLNKKFQRADWGHRPLTAEELAYAREDTHFLLTLSDLQTAELQRLGRYAEAQEEFERLTRVTPSPRQFDPDGYWNLKGARDLDPIHLGILRELYRLRDVHARKENRPPFKILSETALIDLSQHAPASLAEFKRIHGISDFAIKRYGASILKAVLHGSDHPQNAAPRPNSKHGAPLDNAARTRLEHLKEWRKKLAAARGVENDVIVPNDALTALARKQPRTLEQVGEVTGLGTWKLNEYGEQLLKLLNGNQTIS